MLAQLTRVSAETLVFFAAEFFPDMGRSSKTSKLSQTGTASSPSSYSNVARRSSSSRRRLPHVGMAWIVSSASTVCVRLTKDKKGWAEFM